MLYKDTGSLVSAAGCCFQAASWSLQSAARKAGFGKGNIIPVGFPGGSDAIILKGEVSKQKICN